MLQKSSQDSSEQSNHGTWILFPFLT
jgi:hypothetical protein